jgi:hypothetical protein
VLSITLLFIGFVPVLFDDRRRGLADFMAGTTVTYDEVQAESESSTADAEGSRRGDAYATRRGDD